MIKKRPVLLMILDGYGLNSNKEGNAIAAAMTPNLDRLFSIYPHSELESSGESVGLPEGQMGNSEVGHLNIGAGRVVYQISRESQDPYAKENSGRAACLLML